MYLGLFFAFLFLLSSQPFQMTIILIFLILCLLPFLHSLYFFHWVSYVMLMIYLGGLLILFLYLTSTMSSAKKTTPFSILLLLILFFFSSQTLSSKDMVMSHNIMMGIECFSYLSNMVFLFLLFLLLVIMLFFISTLTDLIAPMRQN